MNLALKHITPLDRMVVVDMAPVKVKLSTEFAKYVKSMKEIQDAQVKKQSEADTIMKKTVSVRLYIFIYATILFWYTRDQNELILVSSH